ncbi:hypothetical protein FRB94_003876 [Tulasnella sp. JGI-2019a]|nr:hypothetical protein FRB94_003876 [Tulasnella sp. JGI-2019a]
MTNNPGISHSILPFPISTSTSPQLNLPSLPTTCHPSPAANYPETHGHSLSCQPSVTYSDAGKCSLPGKFSSVRYDDEGDEDLDLEIKACQEAWQLKKQKHNNAHATLKSYQEDAMLYEVIVLAGELVVKS